MPDIVVPGGDGGALSPSGGNIHLSTVPSSVVAEDALATRRGDSLGPTLVRRRAILEYELPQGTTLYVGLFVTMPNRVGEYGAEVTVAGYARQPVASWQTSTDGATARRVNALAITWSAFASGVTLVGWGIWSALTAGQLRCRGFLRSVETLDPITRQIPTGGQPGFAAGDIGLVF